MKVTIIGGAGGVGSSVAFNLLRSDTPFEVVVVDRKQHMVTSHVMDLQDVVALGGARAVRAGTPDDALDSDVVVMAAGVPTTPNADRRVFFERNSEIVAEAVEPLAASGWQGVLVMMTNPVDAHVTRLVRRGLLPRERVLGYTINDSLRMRTGVARALDVPPQSVSAWVLGEHGSGQVPLWDRITVDGSPVALDDEQREAVSEYMDTWYVNHVALDSGRASTWSSGWGGALLAEAIATGSDHPLPASVYLDGEYGVSGAAVGVPVLAGPQGVRSVLEWPLSAEQRGSLTTAAEEIRVLADSD